MVVADTLTGRAHRVDKRVEPTTGRILSSSSAIYELFGLHVETSSPLATLPLPMVDEPDRVDVRVELRGHDEIVPPAAASLHATHAIGPEELRIHRHDDVWWWTFPDDTVFRIDAGEWTVDMRWPRAFVVEDAVTYLLGPILGFVLRLRGDRPLHASVVEIDGRGVMLAGAAGAGKSTLAAELVGRGHRLVTEDVAAVRERAGVFEVPAGFGFVKLWPTSARRHGELARLTPNWDKQFLPAPSPFSTVPAVLHDVYFLEVGEALERDRIHGRDALTQLVTNVYLPYALTPEMKAGDLAFLARFADAVRLHRVRRTQRFADIDALVQCIAESSDA